MLMLLLLGVLGGLVGLFMYSAYTGAVLTVRGVTIGGTTGVGSTLVNGYTGMYVWLERGYTGESIGGLVLLIGVVAFSAVLLLNLLWTGGKTAVQ